MKENLRADAVLIFPLQSELLGDGRRIEQGVVVESLLVTCLRERRERVGRCQEIDWQERIGFRLQHAADVLLKFGRLSEEGLGDAVAAALGELDQAGKVGPAIDDIAFTDCALVQAEQQAARLDVAELAEQCPGELGEGVNASEAAAGLVDAC